MGKRYHCGMTNAPTGLACGGRQLWEDVVASHDLNAMQVAVLEQACRQRDRCDVLARQAADGDPGALRHERDAALAMARLFAALRLPDSHGRVPQARQLRGLQAPSQPIPALERVRLRHTGGPV